MDQSAIEQYLRKAKPLSVDFNSKVRSIDELHQLIEHYKQTAQGLQAETHFFSGEQLFYRKKFDLALKHYLQAQTLPNGNFFCFRASAFLFDHLNQAEKSLDFAKKALKIIPDDYPTLALMEKLMQQEQCSEDVLEIKGRLNALEKEAHQLEELAQIFEERAVPQELFEGERMPQHHTITVATMEKPLNTDSDIFSSPKSEESGTTQALKDRLYAHHKEKTTRDPFEGKSTERDSLAFDELKRLAGASSDDNKEPFNRFMSTEVGLDLSTGHALEQKIAKFHQSQAERLARYIKQGKASEEKFDYCMYYLSGWEAFADPFYMTEQSRRSSHGLFIRWNGKGIAINPGNQFLKNFHKQGLHIQDIDLVIVTDDRQESYADVKEIYELNYQLNKVNQQLHIIRYYFNHKAFQDLSHILKPHFKQERHTLYSLEIFLDSPDVEKIEIAEGIHLNYFQSSPREIYSRDLKEQRKNPFTLGIRLDLDASDGKEKSSVRIGYIGQVAWSPLLAHHLGSCDLLATSFGSTGPNDYNKVSYNHDCLGYYGTYTLLEEIAPKILLTGEYSGREGDIRVEVAQKMRNEYLHQVGNTQRQQPAILPADSGLFICLKTLKVSCHVSQEWVDPRLIRVIKTADLFGKLEYLSPGCCYQF